ncbi:MAG: hypothetical protein ABSD56_00175 [Bryobacteraceae bacterium]|jgi:hypothetical protein
MANGKRITLHLGGERRKFVLVLPPFPEVGDTINLDEARWKVVKVEDAEILARIPVFKRPHSSPEPPTRLPAAGAQGYPEEAEIS